MDAAFETAMTDGIRSVARDHTRAPSALGFAKSSAPEVTLSSIMGRLQASIDQADIIIKSTTQTAVLLCGEKAAGGGRPDAAHDALADGTLNEADRLLNVLGVRLSEIATLNEMIGRRLS